MGGGGKDINDDQNTKTNSLEIFIYVYFIFWKYVQPRISYPHEGYLTPYRILMPSVFY